MVRKTKVRVVQTVMMPKMAEGFLQKNTCNRTLRDSWVYELGRIMESGQWKFNGDPIRIDKYGRLIDGQHRCFACWLTGIPVEVLIVYELDMEVQSTIDRGPRRTTADDMSIQRFDSSIKRASLANKLLHPWGKSAISSDEKIAFHELHREAIDFALEHHYRFKVMGVTQASVAAAIARAWHYYDNKEGLQRFCEVLIDGVSEGKHEAAVIKLRDFLREGVGKGTRRNARELFLKTQASIRAFMRGNSLGNLQMPREDLFPLPEVAPQTGIRNGQTNLSIHHYRAKYPPKSLPVSAERLRQSAKNKITNMKREIRKARNNDDNVIDISELSANS